MDDNIKKLEEQMIDYEQIMKWYLPIEEQLKKMRRSGMSSKDIENALGEKKDILQFVPNILYHGSPNRLDVINPQESTQKGSHVYATDNPVHALFFSIFRNSSIARAHIDEYINENGEYKVKYQIDERVKGALDEIITDKDITIHICDGEQFFKPEGEVYINREWISKNGQSIVPIDRIDINVKQFFEYLEKNGLVEYDRYEKGKDWKTVIDLLSQNYPFGLGTERAKDIESFDAMYDEFIAKNFPMQLEFSKQFRDYVKRVLADDFKIDNQNIEEKDIINYKLRYLTSEAYKLLKVTKDENGKKHYDIDMDAVNNLLNKNIENDDTIKM